MNPITKNIITSPAVHLFDSTGEAYDYVNVGQHPETDMPIIDGDVLVVASEGIVGFAMSAWPVAVVLGPDGEHGAFHALAPDADLTCLGATEARTDTYIVHPCKYVVQIDGQATEFTSKLDAEDAARAARTTVQRVDLDPYEHTETIPADPGTDYSASVRLARETAETDADVTGNAHWANPTN
jgi:hypothetical protein